MPDVSERRVEGTIEGALLVKGPDARHFLNRLFERYRKSVTHD